MAKDKVVLLLRIRLGNGERVYAAPAISKNGRIKPLAAVVGGRVEHHPEGVYALRYRDQNRVMYRQVGTNPDAAQTAKLRLELELRTMVSAPAAFASVLPIDADAPDHSNSIPARTTSTQPLPGKRNRQHESLTNLCVSFIEKYAHGSDDSVYNYTYVGNEFVRLAGSRGKSTPAELDEMDVLAFDRLLESLGNSKSTRAHRYGYLRCFLRHCGLSPSRIEDHDEASGVVTSAVHKKLKSKPVLRPKRYNDSDLDKLYEVSSERHRLIWRTFRMLGLRDEELAYALWDDVDWDRRLWLVRFKPAGTFSWDSKLAWKSKDCEERDIPIPDVLYAELREWRKKNPKAHLVFPTSGGQADIKLLKALKSDWRMAGLNCGHCRGCLGEKNECGKAKLKTFRSTYLSTMLQHVDLRSVQALAGHSSIATTQKYLVPASQDVLQSAANAAFGPSA